jgi:serine/threonine-protein kinase SRPK3
VPGGYHPIAIGDRLGQRYRVLDKLGHGGHSTIWLARDESTQKLVAVKVGIADSDSTSKEAETLASLSNFHSKNGQAVAVTPPVLDRFTERGPNGIHPCLVTTPVRCSLSDMKQDNGLGLFYLPVGRALAGQLVIAVARVHDAGLCMAVSLHQLHVFCSPTVTDTFLYDQTFT